MQKPPLVQGADDEDEGGGGGGEWGALHEQWGAARVHGAFDEVAGAVRNMPALRELRIVDDLAGVGQYEDTLAPEALGGIVCTASTLRLLHLDVRMGAGCALHDSLGALTGLTGVGLPRRFTCGSAGVGWLAALKGLRELGLPPPVAMAACARRTIGSPLFSLDTLVLRGYAFQEGVEDGALLAKLGAAAPCLRALDLSRDMYTGGGDVPGEGLGALSRLSTLEILDLSYAIRWEGVGQIRVPPI